MSFQPKINLDFLRDNKQLLFTIAVVILVPVLIVLNTYYIFSSMQKNMDNELRYKAIMAVNGINASLIDDLDNYAFIQDKIETYSKFSQNIKRITIFKKNDEDFNVVASLNPTEIGNRVGETEKTQMVLAWYGEDAIASLISATEGEKVGNNYIDRGERFWNVIDQVKSQNGEKKYIISTWVSLADVDAMMFRTLVYSSIILIVTLAVVLILIASNGQLYQYTFLFEELKKVDQMKDDFISVASHELRTPLTVINGNVSMIQEDFDEKKLTITQKKQMLETVRDNVKRLNDLVSDLLDVSRIEQNRIKFNLETVNISEIVKKVAENYKLQAKEKGLKLIDKGVAGALFSTVDRTKLEQILVNLVGNAIKYSKEGEVEISAVATDKGNEITIRDTGIGMDEEERKNLFTKFYRIQNEDTKEIVGTGLGLWITKQLVETMNGTIMVDSIKGVGSQFTITFPKVAPKAGVSTKSSS